MYDSAQVPLSVQQQMTAARDKLERLGRHNYSLIQSSEGFVDLLDLNSPSIGAEKELGNNPSFHGFKIRKLRSLWFSFLGIIGALGARSRQLWI